MLSCFHCFCYFSLAKLFEQFWIWHWNLKLLCCRKKTWRELNCHRRCQWKADRREELRHLLAFQAKGGGLIAHNHSTWNPWVNEQGKCWNGLWAMKRQKKWQQGRTSPFCHKVTLKVPTPCLPQWQYQHQIHTKIFWCWSMGGGTGSIH